MVTASAVNSLSMTTRSVAVIGAGAAGLAAARELRREGHKVVIFEKSNQVGGIWVYTPESEPDPMSLDPTRKIIHTSLYASLRTNLPREVMGFREYPFTARPDSRDPRRFPAHREVMLYLQDYAREFGIEEMVRFEREVVKVRFTATNWEVRSRSCKEDDGSFDDESYDAVVVCNGHYTEVRVAEIPGIQSWRGKQMHSHNYRTPEPFRNRVVVMIGTQSSAADISREIAGVAKEVHLASRSVADETYETVAPYDNMYIHSMIESAHEDGSLTFRNGKVVLADIVLHCTGYKYHFPFLDTQGIVTVDDNRVGPLYKHVFPPALAPGLSFVGLPWKVVPFPLFEYQSRWIAGALSGRIKLPSQDEMMKDVKALYTELEASNIPKRYTHCLDLDQFEYNDWLAAQCGCPGFEEWRKGMYISSREGKRRGPETYRDEWIDHELVSDANRDFSQYSLK
ncbi:Flavin-containing monooxygenase FMO GS-OX-like 3 [Linum perenne]